MIEQGATIMLPGPRGDLATVVHVGSCGWGRCRNGAECVTFRRHHGPGSSTTENLPLARVVLVEPDTGKPLRAPARQGMVTV